MVHALVRPHSLGTLSASPGPSNHIGTTALEKAGELQNTPFGRGPPTDLLGDQLGPWVPGQGDRVLTLQSRLCIEWAAPASPLMKAPHGQGGQGGRDPRKYRWYEPNCAGEIPHTVFH